MESANQLFYDKDFRKRIIQNPKELLKEMQERHSLENIEIKVVSNTKDTTYIAIPINSNTNTDVDLNLIAAAGTAGTGTVGSSSAGSAGSCSSISF